MPRAITAIPDDLESGDRSHGCVPSRTIVHYFLGDLSTIEKRDLSDHLSQCDLCSARLLALEISAELSLENLTGDARSTPARKPMRWRRSRPAASITVVPLEGRELFTAMARPVGFFPRARAAEFAALDVAMVVPHGDLRRYDTCGRPGDSTINPRVWDLAIRQLYEAA